MKNSTDIRVTSSGELPRIKLTSTNDGKSASKRPLSTQPNELILLKSTNVQPTPSFEEGALRYFHKSKDADYTESFTETRTLQRENEKLRREVDALKNEKAALENQIIERNQWINTKEGKSPSMENTDLVYQNAVIEQIMNKPLPQQSNMDKAYQCVTHPAFILGLFVLLILATNTGTFFTTKSYYSRQGAIDIITKIMDYLFDQPQLGKQSCASIQHTSDLIVADIPNNFTEQEHEMIEYFVNSTLEFARSVCK